MWKLREREREREVQWTASHLITHVFTYVFVKPSILQSQLTEKSFKENQKYWTQQIMECYSYCGVHYTVHLWMLACYTVHFIICEHFMWCIRQNCYICIRYQQDGWQIQLQKKWNRCFEFKDRSRILCIAFY